MTNIYDDAIFYLTQNIFKEDKSYEYIVPIREQQEDSTNKYERDRDNDGEIDYIKTYYSYPIVGFKVVQEDGNVLSTIKFEGGWQMRYNELNYIHFDNKDYIAAGVTKEGDNTTEYATIYYSITPGDPSSIKAIRMEPQGIKVTPSIARQNEMVSVDVSNIEKANNLTLVNGQGQVVMQKHIANGQSTIQLNTAELPAGLYIVKVSNGKQTNESCKIIVR